MAIKGMRDESPNIPLFERMTIAYHNMSNLKKYILWLALFYVFNILLIGYFLNHFYPILDFFILFCFYLLIFFSILSSSKFITTYELITSSIFIIPLMILLVNSAFSNIYRTASYQTDEIFTQPKISTSGILYEEYTMSTIKGVRSRYSYSLDQQNNNSPQTHLSCNLFDSIYSSSSRCIQLKPFQEKYLSINYIRYNNRNLITQIPEQNFDFSKFYINQIYVARCIVLFVFIIPIFAIYIVFIKRQKGILY